MLKTSRYRRFYYEIEKQLENIKRKVEHKEKTILFISQGTIGIQLSKLSVDVWKRVKANNYRKNYTVFYFNINCVLQMV